jgi:hypothetical protein
LVQKPNRTRLVQKPKWTRLRVKSENVCIPVHGILVFPRSNKQAESPCTGVHIFTFAPQSRPIWLLYQSRPIRLNTFAPTAYTPTPGALTYTCAESRILRCVPLLAGKQRVSCLLLQTRSKDKPVNPLPFILYRLPFTLNPKP